MRTVPTPLQAHLDKSSTTTTRIIKIILKSGFTYGITMLDRDVVYDDGFGDLTYVASNGFDPSALSADISYSVDNAEANALISQDIPGITTEMAEAGELDDAQWICYLINYEDKTQGHVILDAGDLGPVRTRFGLVWIPELLSYAMRLRQPIGSVYSRTCRAIFGTGAGSQTGCGVDVTDLWRAGTVTALGGETDRTFTGTIDADSPPGKPLFPGRVEWLTGRNAGQLQAVETFTDPDSVVLAETTGYAIEIGDTFRIRPDCAKRYLEDCIGEWSNGDNFKGEPYIPVGDSVASQVPGGQLPGAGGYVGSTFTTE